MDGSLFSKQIYQNLYLLYHLVYIQQNALKKLQREDKGGEGGEDEEGE